MLALKIIRVPFGRRLSGSLQSSFYVDNINSRRELTRNASNGDTATNNKSKVRIGCASGFWGDTATAVPQLLYGTKMDFLILDYLSEITMSLLALAKKKNPEFGYAPDFVHFAIGPYLKDIKKKGVRVVTNAGGINPRSCAQALRQVAQNAGVNLKVALVLGDDLMNWREDIIERGFTDMKSGKTIPRSVTTMNAYLGAGPIAKALDNGADIVLTGRCTDSALCLGPLLHSFKWKQNDWDKLAAGSLAGHLIECGAQSTGGIFTDWQQVPKWETNGFPVAECSEDGTIVISKPEGTGGLVSRATVAEQMVYEIGDPRNYVLPDVICDFSRVQIAEIEGGVRVTGARGKPCPPAYKVSSTFANGYRSIAVSAVVGPKAAEKARRNADAILKRCRLIFEKLKLEDFTRTHHQVLGSEQLYGPHASLNVQNSREVMSWMGVHHSNKMALEIFARELASAGTGMAPGFTAMIGGRPKPFPVLQLLSFLYPKDKVKLGIQNSSYSNFRAQISIENADDTVSNYQEPEEVTEVAEDLTDSFEIGHVESGAQTYRLEDLAFTRSGDKGNAANIGVVARRPEFYPYLKKYLTEEVVKDYFQHLLEDTSVVKRYELPGIYGLNFLLEDSLGGGGVASLRSDPQGKGYGQMLLDVKFVNLPNLKIGS